MKHAHSFALLYVLWIHYQFFEIPYDLFLTFFSTISWALGQSKSASKVILKDIRVKLDNG